MSQKPKTGAQPSAVPASKPAAKVVPLDGQSIVKSTAPAAAPVAAKPVLARPLAPKPAVRVMAPVPVLPKPAAPPPVVPRTAPPAPAVAAPVAMAASPVAVAAVVSPSVMMTVPPKPVPAEPVSTKPVSTKPVPMEPVREKTETVSNALMPMATPSVKTTEAMSEAVTAIVKPTVSAGTTIGETIAATADAAAKVVNPTGALKSTTPNLMQGMKTMMKSTEEFVAFGQANLEAFMKSGQIWSAGVQELTKQMATTAKASFEESVTSLKAMSTAKSVKEALEMQSTFAKAALEKAMAESNKLTDASIKLTEQTLAPITARVTVAVEKFGKAA
jgi:phasin family protein